MKTPKIVPLMATLVFILHTTPAFPLQTSTRNDSLITAAVVVKISGDFNKIKVSTKNGVVLLKGTVNSDTEATALIEKVESVDGVKDVNTSELKVLNSQQPLTDTLITAKAKGLLIQHKLMNEDDVNPWLSIETVNGVVYLSGNAHSANEVTQAVQLIKTIKGVKSIDTSHIQSDNNQ